MRKLLCLAISFFSSTLAFSVEYQPWFSKDFELEAKASFLYQAFHSLETSNGNRHYHSHDRFTTLSLATTALNFAHLEIDLAAADTRHRSFGYDHASMTGSYLIMDDIIDDPFSLVFGTTLSQVGHQALFDPGSFHQGRFEGQSYLSFGKEVSCRDYWVERGWGSLLLGFADRGSPWLQGIATWERKYESGHYFRLMAIARWGAGNHVLNPHDFHGYGSVQHRSVDIDFRYSYRFDIWGTLSLDYGRRLYARNFPQHVNFFQVSYLFPFGL